MMINGYTDKSYASEWNLRDDNLQYPIDHCFFGKINFLVKN